MNSFDVFKEIKSQVDPTIVALFYGVGAKKKGRRYSACCPFHGPEKTPSFFIDHRGMACMGCGWKGDAISFVSQMFSLKPLDAAKKIDADFNLRLFDEKPKATKEQIIEYMQDRALNKGLEVWRDRTYSSICSLYRIGHGLLSGLSLASEGYGETLKHVQYLEYILDILLYGDSEEIVEAYLTLGNRYIGR